MRWTFAPVSAATLALAACSSGNATKTETVMVPASPQPAESQPAEGSGACNRIVIDPGHNSRANLATEPIGPGSSQRKIKDGGGTSGIVTGTPEAVVNLAISKRLQKLLVADGYCVKMTRTRTRGKSIGNVARARIANRAHAA